MQPSIRSVFFLISFLTTFPLPSTATRKLNADYQSLQAFRSFVDPDDGALHSWAPESDPCSGTWAGVGCRGGHVTRIILPGHNLQGIIHDSLTTLPYLRLLNLSHNHLTGELPSGFHLLRRLRRIDLSENSISGPIPAAISYLPRLLTLRLQGNLLTGEIPSSLGAFSEISDFNVSCNRLSGEIPRTISSFPVSSFSGNQNLFGKPLPYPCNNPTERKPATAVNGDFKKNRGWKGKTVATIAVTTVAAVVCSFFVILLVIICRRKRKKPTTAEMSKGLAIEEKRVVLFEGCKPFTADDLMKGAAEMLGRGYVGSTYRVIMEGDQGRGVVVKRLRKTNKDRERAAEIERLLDEISGLRHPNVVALKAYYHSDDELLLVYDYHPNGSLRSLLHGNRGPGRVPLYWAARMNLVLGAAQGVAFLHAASSSKLFHQKLSSSNILIDDNGNACVADFALLRVHSVAREASGKKMTESGHKSDVYSFGVILLEILTGRAAVEEEEELPRWVQMVVGESRSYDWLDVDLLACKEKEDEMVGLLHVALLCLAPSPGDRPSMRVVSKMIEDIGERGSRRGRSRGSCTATSPSSTNDGSCYPGSSTPISEGTITFIS